MNSSLANIISQLPDIYDSAKFNRDDLSAVLKGITAFVSGVGGRDPATFIGAAVEVAGHFASKCNVGTFHDNLDKIEKWLTFGKVYSALDDSSDLDFDTVDVGSVPEVMKVI